MAIPFANSPQYLDGISPDFLIPIQTGNGTDAEGFPQMKHIKLSQLNAYLKTILSTLGIFRGSLEELPENLAVNDYFFCKSSFTDGEDSFEAGKYYQWDVDGNWGEISLILNGLMTLADIIDNLDTAASDKALSAKMGNKLNLEKIDKTSIADDLTTDDAEKVLSAKQGKKLNDEKSDKDQDAVVGNIAIFDANGNPVDSEKALDDLDVGFRWVLQPNGDYKLGILER